MQIPKTVRQPWVYMTFWTKEKSGVGGGYQISEVRMGDLQGVEEEQNIHAGDNFLKLLIQREWKRETLTSCLSHVPKQGPGPGSPVCALTENRTAGLWDDNPVSRTSQGHAGDFGNNGTQGQLANKTLPEALLVTVFNSNQAKVNILKSS